MLKVIQYIFAFLIFLPGVLQAQVTFQASAKNVVRINDRFQLTYTLNTDEGKNFRGPNISDFQVLGGPSTSQSSSVQIINGNVSRTVEYSFTYVIQAIKEGIFTIEPATIIVDGKTYESNAVKVQVVQSGSSQQQNSGQNDGTATADDFKDDVFIRVSTDKKNVLQGEQVIATYKLYFRVNINSPRIENEPSFKGFWVNNLQKDLQNYVQYQETYNGQRYQVAELKKVALFPQRSGEILIPAMEGTCQTQVKSASKSRSRDPFFDNFFNDPFSSRYKTIEIPLKSNSLTLNVDPLPSANKPMDFNGAVGSFNFTSNINKTDLKANEAINLKFTVSGSGNVELVDKINVSFPPDFEVYDPKVTKNINISNAGISGQKVFEYILIPRVPGDFQIEAVKFSYFDLAKKQYLTLTTPAYEISVAKGEAGSGDVTYSNVNRSDIRYIGTDIRYIKTTNPELRLVGSFFFGSGLYYILLLLPVALFILFIIIYKNELKKRSNVALVRNRKATKVAQKRLKTAHQYLNDNKQSEFYVEVSQAIWGYLSDKFSIPLANLSIDTVNETLTKKEVKQEIIDKFIETLNNCEFARFAPGESQSNMEQIYNEAMNVISLMERELK
jgi:hypothetical protein